MKESSNLTQSAHDVLAERARQQSINGKGWTLRHDDEHVNGELARAAVSYAWAEPDSFGFFGGPPSWWPWGSDWWKPRDRRRNLVKAGALILAEIERLDRAAPPTPVTVSDAASRERAGGASGLAQAADIVARMAGEHQTGTAVQGLLRAARHLREIGLVGGANIRSDR